MKMQAGLRKALIAAALAGSIFAAAPKRDWKTGTLEAMTEAREIAGAGQIWPTVANGPAPPVGVVYNTWLGYGIHADSMDYLVRFLARRRILSKTPIRPNVTVHGPVKFAIEGTKFYLQDEDGKEFEMVLMQKILPAPKPDKLP